MISPLWDTVILTCVAFLSGSIPFGYVFASARGVDIRKIGSGNIGAANAVRALGPFWGIFVGILDGIKGAAPAYLALVLVPYPGIVGAAAVVGHIFSPWLGFKGGKGVATTLGVFLVLATYPTLIGLGVWILVFLGLGYVSVASIAMAASLPAIIYLWARGWPDISIIAAASGCALLVAWTHRRNMARIASGREPRSSVWKRLWKR